jgi:hypothetical protein
MDYDQEIERRYADLNMIVRIENSRQCPGYLASFMDYTPSSCTGKFGNQFADMQLFESTPNTACIPSFMLFVVKE